MVKNRATHLEGRDRATRQEQRRALGPLRNLTVQPATRARYDKALEKFRDYLRGEGRRFPDDPQVLDFWLSHYIEVLWESGEGRALAADTIASIQDFRPAVKGRLSSSWRLMKTWPTTELPNRAPPLLQEALDILVGYSLFRDDPLFALSLLLGFHGLLRTGELLGVKKQHIEQAGPRSVAILSLGITKGSRRQGAAESVTIREEDTLRRLWQWRQTPSSRTNLCEAPHVWRKKFGEFLSATGLDDHLFRPYSLRRGGATSYFAKHASLDRLLIAGRWQSSKTARVYINEGLAILAEFQLRTNAQAKAFRRQYEKSKSLELQTLEHAPKGRAGGSGSKKRKHGKKPRK